MSEETATSAAARGTVANQSSSVNAVDPAERLAELRNLAFSNFVANINLAQQNALANQQAMNELEMSVVVALVNFILASDIEQSVFSHRVILARASCPIKLDHLSFVNDHMRLYRV